MSDDKTKVGGSDRRQVGAGQGYELRDFAEKHNLTVDQARELIEKHGNERSKLDEAAANLKSFLKAPS